GMLCRAGGHCVRTKRYRTRDYRRSSQRPGRVAPGRPHPVVRHSSGHRVVHVLSTAAGAFWALPRSEDTATGLGDTMSPGSISQLTSSYEIAFRVTFEGAAPPPQQRYYRGPVLHR